MRRSAGRDLRVAPAQVVVEVGEFVGVADRAVDAAGVEAALAVGDSDVPLAKSRWWEIGINSNLCGSGVS
jgi:hypothetical protein